MIEKFPVSFTLSSGTEVVVHRKDNNAYDFTLRPTHGSEKHFTYTEDGRTKEEVEQSLDFTELDALRTFWLMNDDVV
ncbi:MAG TPA: hypothetical protein VM888_11335 [Chitinophagaceae bacterium]|jgi:hypothetical protein|nr:hypothetical protein [Chitinophagaceae bacterium]